MMYCCLIPSCPDQHVGSFSRSRIFRHYLIVHRRSEIVDACVRLKIKFIFESDKSLIARLLLRSLQGVIQK